MCQFYRFHVNEENPLNDISTTLLFFMAGIAGYISRNMNTLCALLCNVVAIADPLTHIRQSLLSGVPDYFGRNKISSGGDLSHYSSASLY